MRPWSSCPFPGLSPCPCPVPPSVCFVAQCCVWTGGVPAGPSVQLSNGNQYTQLIPGLLRWTNENTSWSTQNDVWRHRQTADWTLTLGLTSRCLPLKTTANAPCPMRSFRLNSNLPTVSMTSAFILLSGGQVAPLLPGGGTVAPSVSCQGLPSGPQTVLRSHGRASLLTEQRPSRASRGTGTEPCCYLWRATLNCVLFIYSGASLMAAEADKQAPFRSEEEVTGSRNGCQFSPEAPRARDWPTESPGTNDPDRTDGVQPLRHRAGAEQSGDSWRSDVTGTRFVHASVQDRTRTRTGRTESVHKGDSGRIPVSHGRWRKQTNKQTNRSGRDFVRERSHDRTLARTY